MGMNIIKRIPDMLKLEEVIQLTGIPRSSLYNFIIKENFPKPKKVGLRMARWSKKEILNWIKEKGFDVSEQTE
jgi:prophage regulatory protein